MDIDYLRKSSDFRQLEVKDIVYRINKYADGYDEFHYRNERIATSWGRCCEYAANKVNYRQDSPAKPIDKWKIAERNKDYHICASHNFHPY